MFGRAVAATVVCGALWAATGCSSSTTADTTTADTIAAGDPVTDDVVASTTATLTPATVTEATAAATTTVENTDDGNTDDGTVPEGFSVVMARVTDLDGEVCEVCMWLADDAAERGRGLMGVTSLGEAAAMVFVFDQPTVGRFFMFQTVTPLSIAWVSATGDVLSVDDMDPCTSEDSSECERFGPDGEYQFAIEVFEGDLDALGLEAGASVDVLAGTEAADCAAAAALIAG